MDTAVEEVLEALKKEAFFWRGKQATKAEVRSAAEAEAFDCTASRSEDQGEARAAVERALSSSGLRKKIKAFAFHRFRAQIQQGRGCGDATAAVDWARQQWAELLLRQLRELSKEQKQPFLRRRPKPLSLSKDPSQAEEVSTRHIVDLKALFSLISSDLKTRQAQESSRHARQGAEQSGGDGPGPATVDPVSLEQLRLRFVELSPAEAHLGVPETLDVRPEASKEEPKRRSLGQQLLVTGYPVELQSFCRFGVPASLRREVWSKCLGAVESGTAALQEAARGICEWEWLTDDVLRLDVAEHCANDVSYFPFDELVEALVLALSRDCEVGQLCESGLPQVPLVADAAGALAVQTSELREVRAGGQAMPPSGVVPFKGFSNYACPFAFLADRLETAYPIFRSFYCRHLCRLHTISDHPETLLSLCALFEQLVVSTAPRAAQHLQFVLDSSPLRYAFHWIVTGFVGSLPAEEVLQLWDRVLGFDSVALVPILAAAIVALRSKLILAARRPEEVQLVFSDISCVKAIPLLQSFLFAHELGLGPWE